MGLGKQSFDFFSNFFTPAVLKFNLSVGSFSFVGRLLTSVVVVSMCLCERVMFGDEF